LHAEWEAPIPPLYPPPPSSHRIPDWRTFHDDRGAQPPSAAGFPITAITCDVGDPYPSPHRSTRIPNHLTQVIPVASQIGVRFSGWPRFASS